MLKKSLAAIILIALTAVAIIQTIDRNAEEVTAETGLEVGLKAPDFELENLQGEKVKLSDFEGKKVMLNFWAEWCPPCKAEMPDMQKFHEEAKEDVVILAVNMDTPANRDKVDAFVKNMEIQFPVLLDDKFKVNKVYQIINIPTSFFLDEKGVIRNKGVGAMTYEMMKSYIDDM
ncbi:TlpA family protein disulfide reductase [Cytobacillus spongiae]|jgi:peroxiredoxin|uniref:TlpA family protein disulfide reductase n=1 Tax=Cytobacillus spongiae TaxID=2901381 RepID=UPI001F3A57DD|nr:TlpA disulfide reductase family protein [Cytobacillus spongiae]UII54124.1 TlpA family protein disulfide reductase [Cytobacillus spongiae]